MTARALRVALGFDFFSRYSAGLAGGVYAQGWDTTLAYRDHDGAFGGVPGALDRYLDDNVPNAVGRVVLQRRVRDPRGLRSAGRAIRALRNWRPDVVHVQACVVNDPRLVLALGLPLRRGRYALTMHDLQPHPGDGELPGHKRARYVWLLRNAGLVFAHADVLAEELERDLDVRAPVVVVPHGITLQDLGPVPEEPRLLLFGRMVEYKGIDVMLDAMEAIWAAMPSARLTIAGEGDLPAHALLDDERVEVIHRHVAEEEVPELFRRASLVVLPYIEASQSGVGSLAKGYGRPLLVSDVGGLAELVADGSGELVAPRDPALLAERVVELLGDRPRLDRLAEAGRRSVAATSGWEKVGEITVDAYARHLLA